MSIINSGANLQDVRGVISSEPSIQPIVKIKYEELTVEEGAMQSMERNIAGDSGIYGHSVFGLYGTVKYGGTPQSSFILGHSLAGILGTSKLGSQSSAWVVTRVVNTNNSFSERFNFTNFCDTGETTATWSGNGVLSMTSGEVAQSLSVYKDTAVVYYSTITLDSVVNVSKIELSADGGSHWEEVSNGVKYTFTNTGSDLRFKITADGNVSISLVRVVYG
jgi:hypothetical protein